MSKYVFMCYEILRLVSSNDFVRVLCKSEAVQREEKIGNGLVAV